MEITGAELGKTRVDEDIEYALYIMVDGGINKFTFQKGQPVNSFKKSMSAFLKSLKKSGMYDSYGTVTPVRYDPSGWDK